MKKIKLCLLCLIVLFFLTSCSSTNSSSEIDESSLIENQLPEESSSKLELEGNNVLVVYFSATGNTENAAEMIAELSNAEVYKLEALEPYSSSDLNWTDENSRVVYEHEHTEAQNVKLVSVVIPNWEEYDTVFVGYPIWWGNAAWPIHDFIQSNDFGDKTVIPFATSSSSGFGDSGKILEEMAGSGNWLEGKRFSSRASKEEIEEWLNELNLK